MVETVGIPVEWREHIHPRHGGIAGPAIVLDEGAALRAREWERAARPIAEEMVEHERTVPELGRAVRAWLDGEPDPMGAAAVAVVAVKHLNTDGAAFLDAWVLDHGLAFTACAVTEASSIALGPVPRPVTPGPDGVIRLVVYTNPSREGRGEIRRMTSGDHFGMGEWIAGDTVVALRALAPLADNGTTQGLRAAGLLRGMLYAEPGLAEALPSGAVEALLPRPVVPDSDDLPDALTGKPARSAKVDWADPALLPQILTRGRDRALPTSATKRLLNLLAKKAPEAAAVREFSDRHSLAEFSWALFQRWYALGAPTRHNWALAQLGLIGDDTTVRRLSPLIKLWPGEGGTGRAVAALDVLGGIGSDVALTHLFELARRGNYKGLKARAVQKIDEIAAVRGITPDALADHAVPDFGLDAQGTLVLDYGPRHFTVTFDQQLVPLVVEPNGKVRKSAPKPGPKDDPALAPAAHALFTGLKKDLRTIADREIKRLELAMITRRSWTPDDFHALFVTHPLLGHIVRRLVWITDGGTSFRVAEDHTYADVDDSPFAPAPDARISIAHPILLDDDLDAWAELLADYEILQPFEQLGRPAYRLTDDERASHGLARVEGLVLSYGKAKGHSQGRWESLDANGEFAGGWLARRDPAGLYVVADLSPGLSYYMYGEGEDQKINTLWAGPAPAHSPKDSVPLGEVDPITMSEAIHDLLRSASQL
jgi:hypothetical protein